MPLKQGASDQDRNFNILAEIHSGKPNKQAVAIGYSIQRKARKRS
jgi:hypothetical protein